MNEHDYDFGFGERLRHWVYRGDQVNQAQDTAGLYAWFVRTPLSASNEPACDPYRRVFANRRFTVSASAPLGERMEGRLRRVQRTLPAARPGEELNDQLFAAAFAAFAPPVYLGRATSVRSRLGQHVAALEEGLARPAAGAGDDDDPPSDTDEESSKFGSRMAALLRGRGLRDYRGLFVKVVYAPSPIATKRVEYLLNRTFHPILGRL
ncbi:MAG: hypothetical protein QOH47_2516 [Sphingomonadales bacterium]|jgi:hypothetical protein|nr:hypothetical protein [Sphingomonadales bacterium]